MLDGRGIILTWVPQDKIAEYNLVYFRPGSVRGNHYHPEFDEYLLIVSGEGIMIWKESVDAPEHVVHLSRGGCVRAPSGLIHAFHATMETTATTARARVLLMGRHPGRVGPPHSSTSQVSSPLGGRLLGQESARFSPYSTPSAGCA